MELSEKIYDYYTENLFIIGTVELVPTVYITKKNIRNIPKAFGPTIIWFGDLAQLPQKWGFLKDFDQQNPLFMQINP